MSKDPLTPTLSRKRKEIIHPHLNPLPSRERKIKETVFHREREIRVGFFLRRPQSRHTPYLIQTDGGAQWQAGQLRIAVRSTA
jgi:hypothetical protein